MSIEEVLEALQNSMDIKAKKDGFVSLPKNHRFAVWRINGRAAEGADGYALYWRVTYELRIFYRDGKKEADEEQEKLFEEALRFAEQLTSEPGYDSKDNLEITIYRFTAAVDF